MVSREKPKSLRSYFATLPGNKNAALERIRVEFHRAVPAVEECISYGLPAFKLGGKLLATLSSNKNDCSLHIGSTLRRFSQELKDFSTGKGTIRFSIEKPLSAALVRKLIRARLKDRAPKA